MRPDLKPLNVDTVWGERSRKLEIVGPQKSPTCIWHLNRNNCSSFTAFIPNIISYNSYSYSFTCQPFFTARSATGMHPGSPVNHLLSLNVLAHKCLALSLWKISHNQPVAHISTCCFTGSNNFNDLQSKNFKQIIEVTLTFENFH